MAKATPRLILLRHGETEWAKNGKHTGRTDLPLTEAGEEQARATGLAVAKLGLRDPLVITSTRQRAIRTAELAGLIVDEQWDQLSEWDYGDYEGVTTKEIRKSVPNWTVWTHECVGGESHADVETRADAVIAAVEPDLADRDIVLVGHGHFSRVLVARWVELPASQGVRFAMSPAGCTVLGYERGVHQIEMLNATFSGQ